MNKCRYNKKIDSELTYRSDLNEYQPINLF